MSQRKAPLEDLQLLLGGIQEIILKSSDRQIIGDMATQEAFAGEVSALVELQMRRYAQSSGRLRRRLQTTKAERYRPVVPRELATRIRLLRSLAVSRPDLSPKLRSVFSAGRKPSIRAVKEIIDEFIRLGVLRKRR